MLGPAPCALIRPTPPIGPPVLPATFAKSAIDIGLNFSASAPSGFTWACSNTTWSGLASHSLHARAQGSGLVCFAASTVALEPAKAERRPPGGEFQPGGDGARVVGRTFS